MKPILIIGIIFVVIILIIVGVGMSRKTETDPSADNTSEKFDAFVASEDQKANTCSQKMNLSFVNKNQELKFNNILSQFGTAARGPGGYAYRCTRYWRRRGRCYTAAQCL